MQIVDECKDQDQEIQSALKGLPEKVLREMKARKLSMSSMNTCLNDRADFRKAVWKQIGLPEDLTIPKLDAGLAYGPLSEYMHGTPGLFVFVSDTAAEAQKRFFREIAHVFEKEIDTFNESLAEEGEREERDFIMNRTASVDEGIQEENE